MVGEDWPPFELKANSITADIIIIEVFIFFFFKITLILPENVRIQALRIAQ